jgi:hypothetical protein
MNYRLWASLFAIFLNAQAMAQTQQDPSDEALLAQLRAQMKQQNMTMTPQQEQAWLQQTKALRARMVAGFGALAAIKATGGSMPAMPAMAAAAPAAGVPGGTVSEADLGARIAALPPRPPQLVIEDRSDGFDANGRGFVDPEGRISNFAVDQMSGLLTYLVDSGNGNYLIKVARAGTDAQAIPVATARQNGDTWEVVTAAGARIVGTRLTLLQGAGFLVQRETSAFIYRPGKGLDNIAVPKGYVVATLQRGDVLGTQNLLIERIPDKELGLKSFMALGAALGMNKNESYALLNVKNGQTVPIDISDSGKLVSTKSNCRAKSRLVNVCSDIQYRESLYQNDGTRNVSHYYWRVNWFATPTGPILIVLENGARNLVVQDLNTGRKAIAFSRTLGIGDFTTTQEDNGTVRMTVKVGFDKQTVNDVGALLATAKTDAQAAAPAAEAKTL